MARTIPPARASTASALALCACFGGAFAADPTLEPDARGRSLIIVEPSRTPGGFLYDWPYAQPEPLALGADWTYRLAAEIGAFATHGDATNAAFRNYGDFRRGPALNFLGLE